MTPATKQPDHESKMIDVWSVDLQDSTFSTERACSILNRQERQRAARMRVPGVARKWILAHAALREILAEEIDCEPQQVRIDAEPGIKPVLSTGATTCHFNLSHSDDLALIAVSRSHPVGIDVEHIRAIPEMRQIVNRHFSATEAGAWRRLPAAQKAPAFFDLWVRKESVVKAIGQGLRIPLGQIEVAFESGDEQGLVSWAPSARVSVTSLGGLSKEFPEYRAALAQMHETGNSFRLLTHQACCS